MSTVHIWIEGGTARADTTNFLQLGDTVIVKAYPPYEDMVGNYIAVTGHSCHGCKLYDGTCNPTCNVNCGQCIIKAPSDILEEL